MIASGAESGARSQLVRVKEEPHEERRNDVNLVYGINRFIKAERDEIKQEVTEGRRDDDDLEYEDNPLIKIEQDVLLRSQRPELAVPIIELPNPNAPVMDLFIEQFIDAFAPDGGDLCGKSNAIRKAGSDRMFSPILNEAFEAVSVAYFAQYVGSQGAMAHSYQTYCRVLHHLQSALVNPQQSRSAGVFATVILLMAYESLQHTSERALITHCMGALKLIEFRNPWNHMFGIEHLCFTELLPYWVATALIMRKPTFLARKEWKTVPWSAPGIYKDILARLLEEVVDLPAILWRYDQFNHALRTQSKSPGELHIQKSRLWLSIEKLELRLRRWKRDWADTYPSGQPYEVEFQGRDLFPIFQYVDPYTHNIISPGTLVYPDPRLAQTLCIYYAAMLLLCSADTRQLNRIPDAERVAFAHSICRSLEYYIRNVPGNMINRLAFPIRVAYDSLPEESLLEKRFIQEVFQLVERRKALKSWGVYNPGLSTKR